MLQKFARTLALHWQSILAHHHCPISTGPLEGTSTKMQIRKWQACGFRDQEFYRFDFLAIHEAKCALEAVSRIT
jgi:transposase